MSTIKDVAARAGVSFTTVSHVLNNTRPVSAEARRRVLEAVEEIAYLPSAVARSLRTSETQIVGVLVPTVQNPFFAELVCGVEASCRQAGYSVFLCNSDNDPKRQQQYMRTLLEKRVDGLLLSSAGDDEALAAIFKMARIPAVTVDRLVSGARADRVSVDNQQGACTAVRHLLDLGHQRIACISGPAEFEVSRERLAGWRQALQQRGLPHDDALIVASDFSSQGGYEAAAQLLQRQRDGHIQPVTAVFASNDLMAIGALRAAAEFNLAVPRQLSVIGFDDIDLSRYVFPALSTVGYSIKAQGELAGQMLIERIEHVDAEFKDIKLTPQLIVRDSTSAPCSA